MDFAVIGTLNSYVKQKNLTFAARHKIRTGQTLTNANGNFISMNTSTFDKLREAAKTSTNQAKAQKLQRIKRKLRDGQKLSDEELGFLRVNDPKTYKKAKAVDEAREELKSELKRAKSKAEAQEILSRALVKASAETMSELGALGSGGGTTSAGGQNFGGNVNVSGGENFSTSEISSATENFSTSENFSTTENQQAIDPNHAAQKNSDDKNFSREDVLEKFIWTIRALEDEWARFTNSDAYKNLPDHLADEHAAEIRNQNRQRQASAAYRRAMNLTDR